LDASLALQWFLEDETDRTYGLRILESLSEKRALVPTLWFYEVGNALLMAQRRKRVSLDAMDGFLTRLIALPIDEAQQSPEDVLRLPALANMHGLTVYDAAYLALSLRLDLPLATSDTALHRAAASANIRIA
jgi:predicted nucleic acid-binding protein